jgi:hypothetical protein
MSGTIAGGPIASLTGSRLDPLFRASHPADLRLSAIAAGFLFDSPAKGLVNGQDAGAYVFAYPPLVTTWTVVDMGAAPGGAQYRNPMHIKRKVIPVKLSHNELQGGALQSTAVAFPVEHVFTWDADGDMPAAQLADLQLVYNTGDGETGVVFDGSATYIATRVDRSQSFEFTELAGLTYSDTGVPRPLNQIVFRESP